MDPQSTLTQRELCLFLLIDRLLRLIGRIPQPAAKCIGSTLGEAAFRLDKRHRDITLKNLQVAFEQELYAAQRQSLAKGVYRNLGQILTPAASTGDKQKDVEARTAQYTWVIEEGVRAEPDQWFWVHQRWKTRIFSPWPRQEQSS
jgi:lauroyl/myristoyl acyltransferase